MLKAIFARSPLHAVDWAVVVFYLALTVGVGLYFTRRGCKDMESFFLSSRSLTWYLSGISLLATMFASDTPLWLTNLVRLYGVYYLWQYWAPAIGYALSIVLFAKLWRRLGVVTDIHMAEVRYSGEAVAVLRLVGGIVGALFVCPLTIGWVAKGMEFTTVETMGLPQEYRMWATAVIMLIALVSCMLSGLWGVVYTSVMQLAVKTLGCIVLAAFAVHYVGGFGAMVGKLTAMTDWSGHELKFAPKFGSGPGVMPIWNVIGYFGLGWIGAAISGSFIAQRQLACKDTRQASYSMLFFTVVYYGLICWPWIIVALCSLIALPNLGAGVPHDSAYPRMIVTVLPAGVCGVLVAAMLAAFMSTVSTLFNWGSSYLINDMYKRFLVRNASPRHYVVMGTVASIFLAVFGGVIAYYAENIQFLLVISMVLGSWGIFVTLMRWFWWRMTATAEVVSLATALVNTPLMLFARVYDKPMQYLLNLGPDTPFSSHQDLLGARMCLNMLICTVVAIIVALWTKPADDEHLKRYIQLVKPFKLFWGRTANRLGIEYTEGESISRTFVSWVLAIICVFSLMWGVGKLLLGAPWFGLACLAVSAITLYLTIKRINEDALVEQSLSADSAPTPQPTMDAAIEEPAEP